MAGGKPWSPMTFAPSLNLAQPAAKSVSHQLGDSGVSFGSSSTGSTGTATIIRHLTYKVKPPVGSQQPSQSSSDAHI